MTSSLSQDGDNTSAGGLTASPRPRRPSSPRELPTATGDILDSSIPVEEERNKWYDPDAWYPVKIGEVVQSRYQVLLKLGYGSVSTAWLCRDLV